MLNNIVDNLEQCGQHNIVQCCFHQARTDCAFFAVYGKLKTFIFLKNYYMNTLIIDDVLHF